MKVLHVFKRYLPESYGGIEQVIHQISVATTGMGVANTVLCMSEPPVQERVLQRPEARVVRCPIQLDKASTPMGLAFFREYPKLARGADLIHYHFPYPVQDLLHVCYNVRTPSLVTYHSDIVRQKVLNLLYAPLMHCFLSRVQSIVATSENYFRTSNTLRRYANKVSIIPIGLSRDTFPPPTQDLLDNWRKRVGDAFFLFVGVFRYYKGLNILLEATRRSRHPVVLAGVGPLEAELKARAREHGLDNIHFAGWISDEDKAALLTLCRAVIFPSHLRSEAFGVTLVEGAMFGKPLISAEIGTGTSYVNEHEVTGIVVPPSDPLALSRAMDTLANDPELAHTYGLNAAQRYERFFTAERMARLYYNLYTWLVDSTNSRPTS